MGFCYSGFSWGSLGGLGIISLILNLLLFAGVLATLGIATVRLVQYLSPHGPRRGPETDPLEIARRRVASGEIAVAEFEEIRDRLQS